MSVLCEAISVIVPVRVLEERFLGGVDRYVAGLPNQTYCTDGVLTRVGFLHPDDVGHFIDLLADTGLTPATADGFVDLAVVDQFDGPTLPCAWLDWVTRDGITRAWAVPGDEGALATPAGWEPAAFTKWVPGSDGTVTAMTDRDEEPPGESFTSRAFDE